MALYIALAVLNLVYSFGMPDADFRLTAPGTGPVDLQASLALLDKIKELSRKRKATRPTLEAWSFRIEPLVHKKLRTVAAKIAPVSMSDVVNGLLEIGLARLLEVVDTTPKTTHLGGVELSPDLIAQIKDIANKLNLGSAESR